MISGIGADGQRNSESRLLRDLLQLIVSTGQYARITAESSDEAVDADVANELADRGGVVAGSEPDPSARPGAPRGAVHHHARFFLERHPADEIFRAVGRRASPVLVRIEDAIPVQIPEAELPCVMIGAERVPRVGCTGRAFCA